MAKPQSREHDDITKRSEDIDLSIPWLGGFHYIGNGRTLLSLLIGAALLVMASGSLAYIWWHDQKTELESALNREAIVLNAAINARQACISLLTPEERKEERDTGRFCPNQYDEYKAYIESRRRDRKEGKQ